MRILRTIRFCSNLPLIRPNPGIFVNYKNIRCLSSGQKTRDAKTKEPSGRRGLYLAAAAFGGISTFLLFQKDSHAFLSGNNQSKEESHREKIISRKEVAKHDSLHNGVWITYRGNVYDITEFIMHHPGGSHTIMMGAGGDVELFWKTYTVHQATEVQNLLAQYKIGVLPEDELEITSNETNLEGPYSNDPVRSPLLKVLSKEPFNAETPMNLLTATNITPTEIFFVRNHLPVPEVDIEDYKLEVCIGTDRDPDNQRLLGTFTLDDLKTKFRPITIECIIQCSGNRRSQLKSIKEIKGLNWEAGAISNATWTGVRLVDLFKYLNLQLDGSIRHVQVEGLDCDMSGQPYGASIGADVAFDPNKDVLLAYEMNGQPLTRDHGFPLRFVAPGITGARNVKWLSKIILSDEESNSHWQRNDYKGFSPSVDMFSVDYKLAASIQEMPVQSAICDPADGQLIKLNSNGSKTIPLKGFAYSGGGKMIVRVDVSTDGGQTWVTANLHGMKQKDDGSLDFDRRNRVWSWTLWSLDVPIPDKIIDDGSGTMEILCRAFDSSYNSQPERPETVWNVRGVVNNSWHKISLSLQLE